MVFLLCVVVSASADTKVSAMKGDVYVRHNVKEEWVRVAVGDILKPEDSMKLDKKSSATILIDGKNKLVIPELVIIDLSDLRSLTQDELLLKLAMEKVRNVPAKRDGGGLHIEKITTMHGTNKAETTTPSSIVSQTATLQLNGTRVLYDEGFYATCVLKTKEIFRQHPEMLTVYDVRIMVAGALEKVKLDGEALSEYLSIPTANLSPKQRSLVEEKIAQLKKHSE